MADLTALLAPRSIAIVGLSADPAKHGQRVLTNMRRVGFDGQIWGVHPRCPDIEGVEMFASIAALPDAPDVVISAVPAAAVGQVAREAGHKGAKAVIVFAGGFAEAGQTGGRLQDELLRASSETNVRILGPNSGGVITPSAGVAMSFLTCLDRPASEIRSGPVGLVTQSGGMGSYVHNLAAAAGDGLAASMSTGNEADLGVADGIDALAEMDEVRAIAVILETIRDGRAFMNAVTRAHDAGKQVVVTRIGRSDRGRRLMTTHTGALAKPERVLGGVLDELGVVVAETPAEMFEVASVVARTRKPSGSRVGVITHSGGIAILLSDLADQTSIDLPQPSTTLRTLIEPLIQQGAVDNPLDMGGIIGGANRFADVVGAIADSGEVDAVLAVSSAHPPAHSEQRVDALLAREFAVPVVNLWMAGDVGSAALDTLRAAGAPVTEEPRAAIRAMSALARQRRTAPDSPASQSDRAPSAALTEAETKAFIEQWGIQIAQGIHATTVSEAIEAAETIGYPVVVKLSSPDVTHKTEIGGVSINLGNQQSVIDAYIDVQSAVPADSRIDGVLVERHIDGPEVIIGGIRDDTFGPMILVGIGGVVAEALDDVRVASAPVSVEWANILLTQLAGVMTLTHPRHGGPADLDQLAHIVSNISDRFATNLWLDSFDLNPMIWSRDSWVAVDAAFALVRDQTR